MDKRLNKKVGKVFFLALLSFVFMISFVSAALTDGLVSYWKMDETSGNMIDIAGNYDGVLGGDVTQGGTGKIETAYNFDGVGDDVEVSGMPYPIPLNLTVSMWVRAETGQPSQQNFVFSKESSGIGHRSASIEWDDTNTRFVGNFYEADGGIISMNGNTGKSTGTWYYVTFQRNSTHATIYVNGIAENTQTYDGTLYQTADVEFILAGFDNNDNHRFKGDIDETGYWNRSLEESEILELYNSGNGLAYPLVGSGLNVTMTNHFPLNNSIITTTNFTTNFTIETPSNTTFYNATLNIYNSEGSVLWTKTNQYGNSRGNFTDELFLTTTATGYYSWDVEVFYNDTEIGDNSSVKSDKRYFTNGAIINIITDLQTTVGDSVTLVNGVSYNTNPVSYAASLMTNPNNENLIISASSLGGYYQDNNTILNVNLSNTAYYNITLQSYKTFIQFTQEGSAFNVSGYITDLNYSYTFQNQSYTIPQVNLFNDIIYMRFINGAYNISSLTWDNKSQFYEYDNSVPYQITETIEIFKNVDTSSYFQTQDNSGNIIKNAVLRLYGTIPTNVSDTNSSYALYGQRITDNNGLTVFTMDSEAELYVTASASGYQTKTIRLTASEITTFTADDPLPIRLEKSGYTEKDHVFVSDLWKINGTKVFTSKFDDLNADYFMFIYDYYNRGLKYQTSYEGINRTISLDDTTKSGIITLSSGEQFSNSNNATWEIYIFADDVLVYTIEVSYNEYASEIILDIEGEGLDTNSSWKVVVFLILIAVSSLIGLFFRTPDGDAGVHTFFIGGFVSSLMVAGLGWLSIMGVFHYFGKLTKKWISE